MDSIISKNINKVNSNCYANFIKSTLKYLGSNIPCPYDFKSVAEMRSLENTWLENEFNFKLMLRFINRSVLFGSKGKNEKGEMSPFNPFYKQNGFQNFFYNHTHMTVAVKAGNSYIHELIIIDIDNFDGNWNIFKDLENFNISPNYIIKNPLNPRSLQVGYVLNRAYWVHKDKNITKSSTTMLDTTYKKLLEMLGGDPNFKRYNAKNPIMPTHLGDLFWFDTPEYDLKILYKRVNKFYKNHTNVDINYTDIEEHLSKGIEKNSNYVYDSNSRDCRLFDELRIIAYDMAHLYRETNSPEGFSRFLTNRAKSLNTGGLTNAEIKKTVKSIVKFCFQKQIEPPQYTSYNKHRRENMNKIKDFMLKNYGADHRYSKTEKLEIAERFGIAENTVNSYVSQVRKQYGEKDNYVILARQIEALRNTYPPTKWERISEMTNLKKTHVQRIYERYLKNRNK